MGRAVISFLLWASFPFIAYSGVCTREDLQSAVAGYVAAQQAGKPALMRLSDNVKYRENMREVAIDRGIIALALPIAFHRSILDIDSCRTFSEVIVTDREHPYVLGVRLIMDSGSITGIESVVTDEGDWKFSADNYLTYSAAEDWHVLSANERASRQALIDAANAYMDSFTYDSVKTPWGIPCAHLEGGEYTGDGPRATCKVGIPLETIEIVDRSYVVDVNLGTVNVFCRFGKTTADSTFGETPGLPDSHTFRLVNGRIRYIHSMSVVGE